MNQRLKNPFERFLNLFTEIKAGEGAGAILLALNIFIIFTSYYIIKPVREALILSEYGPNEKAYASAGMAILLLGAIPLYTALASRFSRRRLINTVTLFFTGCLGLFYILALLKTPIGIVFYLWVGIFNLMIPAQFWAFANDLYTPEAGKRIFVVVAFGASAGAVFGGFIAGRLIVPLGVYQLLILSGVLLLITMILTNMVDTRDKKEAKKSPTTVAETDEPLKKGDAFKLVFKSRYLILIAFLVLILNWVNTSGEFILSRIITDAAKDAALTGQLGGLTVGQYIGKFYADFFSIVNFAGLIVQLFLVSRVLKYFGIRFAILVLPLIALGGYFTVAFFPVLAIVRWVKTAENATDYSLNNTVRHALLLPTTREQKYKAKQVIATFFQRAGDVLSAGVVYVGTTWLSFQTKHFALINIGLVLIWLVLAIAIGRENKKLTETRN